MFGKYKQRDSGLSSALLLLLLAGAALLQIVVPLVRVATSYRAVELNIPVAEIGFLSSAFALLPVLFALQIGRYNDRRGEGDAALIGAVLIGVSVLGISLWSNSFAVMLALTGVLGIGQLMCLSSQQVMTNRRSHPQEKDRVLGLFLVATSAGQIIGPLVLGFATPSGDILPDARLYTVLAIASASLIICGVAIRLLLPARKATGEKKPADIRALLNTPGLRVLLLTSSLCVAANDLILVFFPLLGAAQGINAATVGYLLSLRAATSMLSRLAFSRLVQRAGKLTIMTFTVMASAVTTGVLVFSLPAWALAFTLAASGFSMGLAITCLLSVTMNIAPEGAVATVMSLRLTASRVGQFLLPIAAGLTASALGPGSIFAMMGLSLLACGALTLKLPHPETQDRP